MGFSVCANTAGTASSTLNASTTALIRTEVQIGMCISLLEKCGDTHHICGVWIEEENHLSVSAFAAK
jgi:hypothetical protein